MILISEIVLMNDISFLDDVAEENNFSIIVIGVALKFPQTNSQAPY
jgi:hypothetical protein